jgi:type II secretory pathway component PulF
MRLLTLRAIRGEETTMVKVDDPRSSDWDEPSLPLKGQVTSATGRTRQFGIGRMMVWLIYFAILSLAIRGVYQYGQSFQQVILGVVVGLGLCYFGFWAAMRFARVSFLGWIVFIIGYCVAIASTNGGLAIPTIPILIGVIVYLSFRRRANEQDALLGIIALSADRGMPLAPGIFAFSVQSSGIIQIWAETLAELLRRGVSLPEAASGMPRLIPRAAGLLIRMGAESGNLASGLREAVQSRTVALPMAQKIGTQLAYLAWVACTGVTISGFLLYFITPKFEAIFKDFGVALPELTIQLIRVSHVAVDYFWVPVMGGLGLGFVFLVSLFQGGDMSIPVVDRLFARRHTILILRSLTLFVEADRPISTALDSLANWYPTRWVRKKLTMASADVDQGHDWIEALRSTGLLSGSDAGVLASAQRAGNLAWAIRELVSTSERRWNFRLQGLLQLTFIGSMLVLGALVFLLAVAYFSPLTTLIMRLSQ